MVDRKLDELASDIDDANRIVEELQDNPRADIAAKLDELHETLEHADERADELEDESE
jgi:hypothetical protein